MSIGTPQGNAAPETVSMMVMAYNQEDYVEDAVRAAFAQTYQPLEIVLSDDCSTDRTFVIMERLAADYEGPHEVRLNRNTQNLGFIGHVNKVFELCRGALIVYCPGDDISEPDRVEALYAAFRDRRPLLVHSDAANMNPDGTLNGLVTSRQDDIAAMDLAQTARSMSLGLGATCAWNPELFRLFGPIVHAPTYDDLIFFFRARLLGRIAHVPRPLVRYRYRVGLSNRFERTLKDRIEAERKLLDLAQCTYRQRILDCQRVAPERTDILEALESSLAAAGFKKRLYREPLKTLPTCLLSREKFGAALSVLNRLRKLAFRARVEERKRAGLAQPSRRSLRRRRDLPGARN